MNEWTTDNIIESWISANKFDRKGREIGYIVGFNTNGVEWAAWVQNGRKDKMGFKDFGAAQRSKMFPTIEQANRWAYATAKERIAKL
jgi:hypothetical protein